MKYVEITLLDTADVPLSFLWKKVFMKLHLRFVELKDGDGMVPYGVSFPGYSLEPLGLGSTLRVFAVDEGGLDVLDLRKTFSDYTDYVHVTGLRNVPDGCSYSIYRRMQPNGNLPKIARRKAIREGIDYSEAFAKLNAPSANKSSYKLVPYIYMKSLSTYQDFCLFVKKEPAQASENFIFTTYGLSSDCSVPVF